MNHYEVNNKKTAFLFYKIDIKSNIRSCNMLKEKKKFIIIHTSLCLCTLFYYYTQKES